MKARSLAVGVPSFQVSVKRSAMSGLKALADESREVTRVTVAMVS